MTSVIAYNNLGTQITLDVYSSNLGGGNWEVAVFNRADAAPGERISLYGRRACHANADL